MEDHTEDPTRESKIPKRDVVFTQRVSRWDLFSDLLQAVIMGEQVHQGEKDGSWLLHAEEAVEGPFSVELHDGFEVWWVAGEAVVGYDVLTSVIAFGGAVPEEETMVKGWMDQSISCEVLLGALQLIGTYGSQLHYSHNSHPDNPVQQHLVNISPSHIFVQASPRLSRTLTHCLNSGK